MTALMQRALRRLSAVPESEQDRLARHLLSLPELAEPDDQTPPDAESFASVLSVSIGYARTKEEIDRTLSDLRDEWER